MITALVFVALLVTLIMPALLPFWGWGSGADAAGRGMAMFAPGIAMTLRLLCHAVAIWLLASDGGLSWTGLGAFWFGLGGTFFLMLTGIASLVAAIQLIEDSPPSGTAAPAWVAVFVLPLTVSLWLLAEGYSSSSAIMMWSLRGLVAVLAILSAALALGAVRAQAKRAQAARAVREAADREALARADALGADAPMSEALAFLESLPESDWQVLDLVKGRLTARPDRSEQVMALLDDPSRDARLRAARFAGQITMPDTPAYYAIAAREISEIIVRLEAGGLADDILFQEGRAAIALAWPAMQTGALKRSQMAALHAALGAQPESSACRSLVYEAGLLRDSVTG